MSYEGPDYSFLGVRSGDPISLVLDKIMQSLSPNVGYVRKPSVSRSSKYDNLTILISPVFETVGTFLKIDTSLDLLNGEIVTLRSVKIYGPNGLIREGREESVNFMITPEDYPTAFLSIDIQIIDTERKSYFLTYSIPAKNIIGPISPTLFSNMNGTGGEVDVHYEIASLKNKLLAFENSLIK